jgi:hypothetical protein
MAIFFGNPSESSLFPSRLNVPALGSLGCPAIKLLLPCLTDFGDIIRVVRNIVYKIIVSII